MKRSSTSARRWPALWSGLALVCGLATPAPLAAASERHVLDAWLAEQTEIATWSAQVKQTRTLAAIVRPLETEGEVWFQRPNRFRWQLGDPPRTIAVRTADELMLLYPRLRQAERYAFGGDRGAWKPALALLEVGLPNDPEGFDERYEVLSVDEVEAIWGFDLQPVAAEARRLIQRVRLEISETDLKLLATELTFPDGSIMRNDFSDHQLNPELDPALFTVELEDDYEVVEPLAKP
ncbi:MAG: outer membrane lipoprotein carrier protein LolA [Acidobacteriota bacterium]